MKKIIFNTKARIKSNIFLDNSIVEDQQDQEDQQDNNIKTREIIKNKIANSDISLSQALVDKIHNHKEQITLINKLYMGDDFCEKKFVLSELRSKIASY